MVSGLIGGVDIATILLRVLIVIIIVTIFTAIINLVAVSFLDSNSVENTTPIKEEAGQDGSRVNIVLTEDDNTISELPSEPDDISGEVTGDVPDNEVSVGGEPSRTPSSQSQAASMDIDTLPDLGTFSTTFTSATENEEKNTDSDVESGYNESTSVSSGNRLSPEGIASTIAEQNSPEDLAKAVKTVLKK